MMKADQVAGLGPSGTQLDVEGLRQSLGAMMAITLIVVGGIGNEAREPAIQTPAGSAVQIREVRYQ